MAICAVIGIGSAICFRLLDEEMFISWSAFIVVVAFFFVWFLYKYLKVKDLEKRCTVYEGHFVGVERAIRYWRNRRFIVKIAVEVNGVQVIAKTVGIYSVYDISGLTTDTVIKIGYTDSFDKVITL